MRSFCSHTRFLLIPSQLLIIKSPISKMEETLSDLTFRSSASLMLCTWKIIKPSMSDGFTLPNVPGDQQVEWWGGEGRCEGGLKERQSGLTSPLCLAGVSFSRNLMLSSTTAERLHVENKDAAYATCFLLLFRIIFAIVFDSRLSCKHFHHFDKTLHQVVYWFQTVRVVNSLKQRVFVLNPSPLAPTT